jgi:hypothetical protein
MNKQQIVTWFNWFWKNWNESIMFLLGLALFFLWPVIYRTLDATAGSFDAGMLHTIPTAFLITQFILFSSWLTYKLSFPRLHKWFDDKLESYTVDVQVNNLRLSYFSFGVYAFYCTIQTVIFVAVL